MTFFRLAFPLTIFLNEFLGRMWFLLPLAKYFAQFDLVYFFSTFEYENCQTENLKYLHSEYPDNYHLNSAIANILLYLLYLISFLSIPVAIHLSIHLTLWCILPLHTSACVSFSWVQCLFSDILFLEANFTHSDEPILSVLCHEFWQKRTLCNQLLKILNRCKSLSRYETFPSPAGNFCMSLPSQFLRSNPFHIFSIV